ncbi:ribonuclease P protein subunit p30-like protein [Dinothrombium tinctorium]|uniref:Ribonuclease P protein subunit p30-like protein n=1 Tax=Dinothrombium tinctorium TaxID=1965070 RepID=A0A3S3Q6J4_9ACAR|nr:ribonuclease P protein subunit p30-like protein [Dinothrombium tinctorium]
MDLNIVIEDSGKRDSKEEILDKLRTALKLNYKSIAFSVRINDTQLANPPKAPKIEWKQASNFELRTRVTIVLEDASKIHKLSNSPILKEYDLLAIEVINDKILSQLCGGHLDCDIISFSLSERLTFNLKKTNFTVPQTKGTCFEVNYRQLLLDSTSRQNVITVSQSLFARLRGRNVLLSSGALSAIELRGPHDVANLGLLLELEDSKARAAVFTNGLKAIKHSEMRKTITSEAVKVENESTSSDKWLLEELNIKCESNKESECEPEKKRIKTEDDS